MKIILDENKNYGLKKIRLATSDEPRKRHILRSIFIAFLEIAYDRDNNELSLTWKILSDYSSLSLSTLKNYTHYLEEIGLIVGLIEKSKNNTKKNIISLNDYKKELELINSVRLDTKINEVILEHQNLSYQKLK